MWREALAHTTERSWVPADIIPQLGGGLWGN
jgi:hypothetical protein